MTTFKFFCFFALLLAVILLAINLIFAPHLPDKEKKSAFECGFHSFIQSRSPIQTSFFSNGLTYLLLGLEIIVLLPGILAAATIEYSGLTALLAFTLILSIGFVYELGTGALEIESKQSPNLKINSTNI